MSLSQVPLVMDRLHELRDMFGVGQRAAELVEGLFDFLNDVVPLIHDIDGSLRESTGHMPQATSQLQSVTQATEMATTEILDRVDAVLLQLEAAPAAGPAGPEAPLGRLRERLRERLADLGPAFLDEAEALLDEDAALRAARLEAENERLKGARDGLNQILISLQVQDITAQQLASVNHLIESIRYRLNQLVVRIADRDAPLPEAGPTIDPDTFNEHARYEPGGSRQAVADLVTSASQDDIDALFGGPSSAPAAPSQNDIDALFGAPPAAPAAASSQDDIDALFGSAPAPSAPSSQSDIDALFGAPAAAPSGDGAAASQDDIDALFGS